MLREPAIEPAPQLKTEIQALIDKYGLDFILLALVDIVDDLFPENLLFRAVARYFVAEGQGFESEREVNIWPE